MEHQTLDILAFGAHPDDVEIGCGGSLALNSKQGYRVAIADLTEGEKASRGTVFIRKEEKQRAAQILGIPTRYSLNLPDTQLDNNPSQRLPIIELIRQTRPKIILAPYWEDRHPDHVAASILVKEACFLAGVSTIGNGEPYRPPFLYFYMIHFPFSPSFVIDVSSVWSQRMEALQAYKSQFSVEINNAQTALTSGNFLRFVEARAIYFGAMIGANYGEPFFSISPLPFGNFPGLGEDIWANVALSSFSPYLT